MNNPSHAGTGLVSAGAPFTHTPRPAIRSTGRHAGQTRFGGDEPDAYAGTVGLFSRTNATLYRNDDESHAECAIVVRDMASHHAAELTIYLDPAGLRDLACRLLDAAADIEAHPAQCIDPAAEGVAA